MNSRLDPSEFFPGRAAPALRIAVEPAFDFASLEYESFFDIQHATVFQQPFWLNRIHKDLVPSLKAKQFTITVRDSERGTLKAVFPFVVQKIGFVSTVQPADFGVCDANAIVADPLFLEIMAQTPDVIAEIDKLIGRVGLLMFRKVRRDGFDVKRLFRNPVSSVGENAAYHSETGDDFEVWQRKTISRKMSKELGRLNRQVERDFGTYEHRLLTSESDIRDAFAYLRTARRGRFKSDLLAHDIYFDFYQNVAIEGAASGRSLTYASCLNGEPVAVLFGLGWKEQCHALLIGIDTERLGRYSVGTQLLYRTIKMRFEAGHRRLDFGLGNSGYKSHFRVEETPVDNITAGRSLAGLALSTVYHRAKPLKNALKRLTPGLH